MSRFLSTLGLLCALIAGASTATAQTVLIRDVHLLDANEADAEVLVSLLIKNGELDVVTQDRIASGEADIAVDAAGGFLLGKLDLGQTASFLIFDADPRVDIQILLDTATHARFAINDGFIVKNTLLAVGFEPEESGGRGWLGYTPPPMALPTTYLDTAKWNRWETKYVSGIFLAAVMFDRIHWSQDEANEEQVGDIREFDGGEIRGLRFGAVGTINFEKPWVYTIFGATNAFDKGFDTTTTDDITLFDYRLDIPLWNRSTVSIGKQKEPISQERLMGLIYEPMQERTSVSDAFMPSRNVGVVLNSSVVTERMSYAVGIFNDWFDIEEPLSQSSTQVVGRVTGLPVLSPDESTLVHVGFGARHSNAKQGVRFLTEPEFNQAPAFVDTAPEGVESGVFAADHLLTYDFELSVRQGPVWIASEFVRTDVAAPESGDPTFSGYHVTASWNATGEMRGYNKLSGTLMPLQVARSVNQGGWGAWEFSARWSEIDLSDEAIDGGFMRILSLGANWWLTQSFQVGVNYRHIELDRFGISGTANGVMGRVMLSLE